MRIALVHALKHSIAPIEASFARLWPDAQLMNLLDDSLSADLARDGRLTDAMTGRFLSLGRYAAGTGADALRKTAEHAPDLIVAVEQQGQLRIGLHDLHRVGSDGTHDARHAKRHANPRRVLRRRREALDAVARCFDQLHIVWPRIAAPCVQHPVTGEVCARRMSSVQGGERREAGRQERAK